jgi:hypothetical protein
MQPSPHEAEREEIPEKYRAPDGSCKVFLPPSLFDDAQAAGYDMRWYVKQELIPL